MTPILPVVIQIASVTGLAIYVWRQRIRGRALRASSRLLFGAFFTLAIWLGWVLENQLMDFS